MPLWTVNTVEERGGLYGMSLKKAALISRAVFSGATTRNGLLGRLNPAFFRARFRSSRHPVTALRK
jgi:hypothetical protein